MSIKQDTNYKRNCPMQGNDKYATKERVPFMGERTQFTDKTDLKSENKEFKKLRENIQATVEIAFVAIGISRSEDSLSGSCLPRSTVSASIYIPLVFPILLPSFSPNRASV